MSYYSDIDNHRSVNSYPSRRDTLQYYLEDLHAELDALRDIRPLDPMHVSYDGYFYANGVTHYYECESPRTVQGLLSNIEEVNTLIAELDAKESSNTVLEKELPGQLMISMIALDHLLTPLAA